MPVVNPEKLIRLQGNADEVRNVRISRFICISYADLEIDLYTRSRGRYLNSDNLEDVS